jgi:hypothetical protein
MIKLQRTASRSMRIAPTLPARLATEVFLMASAGRHPRCLAVPAAAARAAMVLSILFTMSISTLAERSAFAQDQATIDKLVQLNKKAMDDYDTADFDTAKKSLLDAEKLGKRAGLEGHPVMARTYIHLGALYVIGYKDKPKAQHYFGKALDIQPDINLDRTLTSVSVRDLFATVKAQRAESATDVAPPPPAPRDRKGRARPEPVAAEPAPAAAIGEGAGRHRPPPGNQGAASDDGGAEPDLPASIAALDCPYPDDTPPGRKVTLRCAAAANLPVSGATLHYKGHGMSDYEDVPMARSPKGWWQATIPRKRVDGTSLQFYFEGLDASDKPVVSNGRAESPNVMLIVERGNNTPVTAGGEEENPLEHDNRSLPKLLLGKYDKSRIGVDSRYGNRRFWIGLGLGSGFVYAINGVAEARVSGRPLPGGGFDMTPDVSITGFGWAGLGQLAPEIGFQINPDWAISIEGRNQWIPQASSVAAYTAAGAHAALLKVIRYTTQDRFRLFFALAAGGGEGARMNIQTDVPTGPCPNPTRPCANPDLKDTVRVGGVLLGGTVGVYYEISRRFSWIAELNALFGLPKRGLVLDLNTGLQVNFGDTSGAAEAAAAKKVNSVSTSVDDEEPK